LIMIMGYGIIAVPTGIVTAEYSKKEKETENEDAHTISPLPKHPDEIDVNSQTCSNCLNTKHKDKAKYCDQCGYKL